MQQLRWNIITLVVVLISAGVLFLYSASGVYSDLVYQDSFYFVKKQILFISIGFLLSLLVYKLDLNKVFQKSRLFLSLSIFALIAVLIFGVRAGGAKRWFRILEFGIQPIEFIKIVYIIYLAGFLTRKKFYFKNFKMICLPIYIIAAVLMSLLLLQPDFGNAMFIAILTASMLYFANVPFKFLFCTILGVVPFIVFAFWRLPYLRFRLLGFISPWQYHRGVGFQLIQSFIAIGSGKFLGQGLGLSRQKLFYLPQAHNDFIFSIIAEELGFLGASLLLLTYIILIWNFFKILSKIKRLFEKMLLLGLTLSFSYQIVINIGVCLGLLPTKGLPLPFISYGGSSLISNMIVIALILNLSKDSAINEVEL
ncbi:MAG: putative lipid II flippase FtsW [Candidatus Saelkia tenebricola]|nr:putative lipid II flippase FtsW [Candidatus Saelkia tenebricola]